MSLDIYEKIDNLEESKDKIINDIAKIKKEFNQFKNMIYSIIIGFSLAILIIVKLF